MKFYLTLIAIALLWFAGLAVYAYVSDADERALCTRSGGESSYSWRGERVCDYG